MIPWAAIADDTRSTTHWRTFNNAQDFTRKELADLFGEYWRDLQQTQPNHIEIVAEKFTVKAIVQQVAMKFCIPVTIGRSYCSITPRREMAQRFQKSEKSRLIILVVSDFDPDGKVIAESFARSMRDDFGIEELVPIKVALTADQVVELNLKPPMEAKRGSPQYKKFVEQHGTDVFELEAVSPKDLQVMLTDAIDEVIDIEAFNAEVDAEREDAASLNESRQRACLALGDLRDTKGVQ